MSVSYHDTALEALAQAREVGIGSPLEQYNLARAQVYATLYAAEAQEKAVEWSKQQAIEMKEAWTKILTEIRDELKDMA